MVPNHSPRLDVASLFLLALALAVAPSVAALVRDDLRAGAGF
jgi:hypothetical protein